MATSYEEPPLLVVEPTQKHTATLIFLHGSGSDGRSLQERMDAMVGGKFTFPHIRILYPTASLRPYTPAMGELFTVWFDRPEISPHAGEDMESIKSSHMKLQELVKKEEADGIPRDRIILGGISMGGGMSLLYGYGGGGGEDLAGVFALSSFLDDKSYVYQHLEHSSARRPVLFQSHGDADDFILYQWGKDTYDRLRHCGVHGSFVTLPGLDHECINDELLQQLVSWISEVLPQ